MTSGTWINGAGLSAGTALGAGLRQQAGAERIEGFGATLRRRIGGNGSFAEGVITPFLMFCVDPRTLLGSITMG